MQPAEIIGRIKAHEKSIGDRLEYLDTLAWMMGNYNARAYHEPQKYPKSPCVVKKTSAKEMDDSTMKEIVTTYAVAHNEIVKKTGGE